MKGLHVLLLALSLFASQASFAVGSNNGVGLWSRKDANRPTVDLIFTQGNVPNLSFSRTTTATQLVSGSFELANTNVPRYDIPPSNTAPIGLLLEEARTNSLRNNSMSGAAVGVVGSGGSLPTSWAIPTPGGLTTTVVAVSQEDGINYIDLRINGTTSGTFYQGSFDGSSGASASQTWTHSAFVKMVSGSTANLTSVNIRTSVAGGSGTNSNNIIASLPLEQSLALSRTRKSIEVTTGTGATTVTPNFTFGFSSGVAVDITLRIGAPQLELGNIATSIISTTGVTSTRAVDVATVTPINNLRFNNAQGTFYIEGSFVGTTKTNQVIARISAGGSTNYIDMINSDASSIQARLRSNNVTQCFNTVSGLSIGSSQVFKSAFAYAQNDTALSVNGSAVAVDTSVDIPQGTMDRIELGTGSGAIQGNVRITRIMYWPKRLPNSKLQELTR